MNKEMMDAIEKDNVVFLSTCADNIPNVVPIGFARPLDNENILLVDNFMNKTHENLKKNPKAAIVVRDASKCPFQFKAVWKYLNQVNTLMMQLIGQLV